MIPNFDERIEQKNQYMALYESSMDKLVREMMKNGVSSKELANELKLSQEEVKECQNVLEYRRHAFELLKEEKEELEEKVSARLSKNIGEMILEVSQDKEISQEELADKLHISTSELIKLEQCKIGGQAFGDGKAVDREFLKKLSGVLGVPYTELLVISGYNCVRTYPEFYTEEGEAIDVYEVLVEMYYRDPTKIAKLKEMI